MSPKSINIPLKMTLRAAQSLRIELCLACFSSCEWERCCEKFERLMFVNYYLALFDFGVGFCLRWFSKATISTWALSILRLRCLVISKTYEKNFVSWAKHKFSRTTLSTFQKCLFELSFASFFGCNYKKCFETFLRSLYLNQYMFFVKMQSHVWAALVVESFVWYWVLGLVFEIYSANC